MLSTHSVLLVTFLVAIEPDNHSSAISCKIVAYLLHYLICATMTWMMCEGWHLYQRFVQVLGVSDSFGKYAVFGWGLPLVPVVVGASAFGNDYGSDDLCWVASGSPALYLVVVPIGIAIVTNVWFFQRVLHTIIGHVSDKGDASAWTHLKAAVTFASTLGLFYVFALVVFATGEVVFQYLLALTATSQGAVVFYFHIFVRPDFRNHINRGWRRLTLQTPVSMKTTTSASTHQDRKSSGAVQRRRASASDWRSAALKTSTLLSHSEFKPDAAYLQIDPSETAKGSEAVDSNNSEDDDHFGFGL